MVDSPGKAVSVNLEAEIALESPQTPLCQKFDHVTYIHVIIKLRRVRPK
jgi:hypothetical protein